MEKKANEQGISTTADFQYRVTFFIYLILIVNTFFKGNKGMFHCKKAFSLVNQGRGATKTFY